MGAFDKIFKRPKVAKQVNGYFQMLDGYTPIFTSYDGGVYEMELTRACIHTFANHCSKLLPTVNGPDYRGIKALLEGRPNPFMTGAQFVYKVATIYDTQNTCFIVPILDDFERIVGYYPVNPQQTEVIDVGGEPWLRYTFRNGKKAAVELSVKYIPDRFLPDKAIDLLDEAAAALRISALTAPQGLKELEEELGNVGREKEEAIKAQEFERAAALRDREAGLQEAYEQAKDAWSGNPRKKGDEMVT